ncbi:MAG TPA: hypothetical protein VH592_17485 [Gemmataceae bacterium]|jgi:hypothetical protein
MFRRLLLSPERLHDELKRVQDGILVQLPVKEFDELVERAKRARTRTPPPQLLEARYHATLKDESLIGDGQWKLIHTGPGLGLLNVQPFNLALRQARFENSDALIAAFDGKNPALLVDLPGERTVSLDWSARAESSPEGFQFHLEMPSCPVALLELDVPADRTLTVLNDDSFLSGPHEAESRDLHRWKIVCGGRQRTDHQRVDIRISHADRPTAVADSLPVPLVHQKTTQKLSPEGLDATFEVTLDGLHSGIRELVCECDAELRLRDVVGPGVESCSFQVGDGKKPSRLTIRLGEPLRSGTWQILCLAPPIPSPIAGDPRSMAWRSPGLRLINGVPRGETLTLWFHPDLHVESWDSGSYRLSSSEIDRTTGSQVLTLMGGGIGPPRRPAAHMRAFGVEFSTHQLTWWRCDASGMDLTAQINWDVSQGQLFQLPVVLPAGWDVEKIEMNPSILLRDWYVRKAADNSTLVVDLSSPLGSPQHGKTESRSPKSEIGNTASDSSRRLTSLTIHMRPAEPSLITGKRLPFPAVVPLGARLCEGSLALDCDEQLFHLDVQTAAERTEPEREGPWGQQLPVYYYRYRGQPVTGQIQIRSRPPRLRAKCETELVIGSGEAVIDTQLLLEAEAGSPNTIELSLSAGDGGPWPWRSEEAPRGDESTVNRVRRSERLYNIEISCSLHLLAASHPLQAAVVEGVRPTDERWRLTLARPLRPRESLRLRARRRLQPRDNRWEVPLPIVLGAERMEGEVVLHLAGADLVPVQSVGLEESVFTAEKGAATWRVFHYGDKEAHLILSGEARALDRSRVASIERATLFTYVGLNNILRHHFSFQVANWGEHTLPLRLSAGSWPLAVQVDGRWLPRLVPDLQIQTSKDSTGPIELALPVPTRSAGGLGDGSHSFGIVYLRPLPPPMVWQSIDDPVPQLPMAPIALRRLWRLHPKLTPLRQDRYKSVPGTLSEDELAALPRQSSELFRLPGSLAQFDPFMEDQQASASEALKLTVRELRKRHSNEKVSLGEVLSDTAFLLSKPQTAPQRQPLIVDDLALREVGVRAETRLTMKRTSPDETTPPWEECGLTAVPARSVILLTTSSGRFSLSGKPLSEEVKNALADAAQFGQDASGRFVSALHWLYPVSGASSADLGARPRESDHQGGNWSEWEPTAGQPEDALIVVRRDSVTTLGLVLSSMLMVGFWLLRRIAFRRRLMVLLLALTVTGLAVLWLPEALRDLAWWPLLASSAAAVLAYFGLVVTGPASLQHTSRQSKKFGPSAVTAGMLVLSLLGWNSRADAPPPATVFYVPAPADASDKQMVLVPADLLERLKVLTQPPAMTPGGQQTVLLDASYEGQLVEDGKQAEFVAVFSAHSLGNEPTLLSVPLAGVQLIGEVLLDGARIAPLAAPQAGYALTVRGRGRHKIEMRFRVPVIGTEEDRNVMFTAPPLLRSRLSWRVPSGTVDPQVLVKNGAQWTTHDGGGQRLEADLGALPLPVHLHWYQPGRPTRMSYQAAYLWDLGLEASHLTAWLRYRVEQGAVKTLEVDLPAELEISSAAAQRIVMPTRPSWRTRFQLHDWHVTRAGGKRVLHLMFPYPISGDFQVALNLLPHEPLTSSAALPLPLPRGIRSGGPHYLAFHTQPGLDAERATSQNLTRIDNKEFAADWLRGPNLGVDFRSKAYRIPPDQLPQLFLRLEARPPRVQSDVSVTVRVNSQRAEIEAVADVISSSQDLAAIECELPPNFYLASLTGEDVRTWKQDGSRLLVWLNRTAAKARIHLSGWLQLSLREDNPHLELSGLRLLHAEKQHTRLFLATSGDRILASLRTQNLQAVKSEPAMNGGRPQTLGANPPTEAENDTTYVFETWDSTYHLSCQVQPSANAIARVLTVAEVADRELRFTTTVDYTVPQGDLRQIRLRLRNWEEENVELQAERVALRSEPRRTMGERTWRLPLQAGVRGHYQLTLRGKMPLEKTAAGVPMPEVLVQGVERVDYFLAVVGGELTGQAKGALQALQSGNVDPKLDPTILELVKRGERVWRVAGTEWQVRLLPQTRDMIPTPIRIYQLEQWAAVLDGQRWLHEARLWLRHEGHANLTLDFAAPVRVLAASIDAPEATSSAEFLDRKNESDNGVSNFGLRISEVNRRVWLPLPGQPGVRCVRLRWMYDSPEPLDRPNLAPPKLPGAATAPILWTVIVPLGWQTSLDGPLNRNDTAREAERALWHAEAQLRICQDLAKDRQDTANLTAFEAAQKRFDRYSRLARRALDLDADSVNLAGPQGRSLAAWLEDLQAKNRLLKSEVRFPRTEVPLSDSDLEFRISDFELVGGIPVSGQAMPGAETFILQLTSQEKHQTRQALLSSGGWLGVLLAAWILSVLPFSRTRLHFFWPEQIALFGLFGWYLAGFTSIVLGLLLMAGGSRIFLMGRSLRTLFRKRRRQPSTMTAGDGAVS